MSGIVPNFDLSATTTSTVSPTPDSAFSASSTDVPFPVSTHMRLGQGISRNASTGHHSCFEMGFSANTEMEASRLCLSESDLFSLFEQSNLPSSTASGINPAIYLKDISPGNHELEMIQGMEAIENHLQKCKLSEDMRSETK